MTNDINLKNAFTIEELTKAAKQCRRNVSWKETVTRWMNNLDANIIDLKTSVDGGNYRILKPTVFRIEDPKPRVISATRFRDRVLHRSICNNGGYALLTQSSIYDNCACQVGKGTTFAIDRLKVHLKKYFIENQTNEGYIVRLDIRKYFPSIPHKILKRLVAEKIKDRDVLKILFSIIDDFVNIKPMVDQDLDFLPDGFGERGLGLGSQLNQLFALLYLSKLDNFVKRRLKIRHYLRYMDDMILVVKTKEEATKAYSEIESFILKYGLVLNPKSKIMRLDQPFHFLKIQFSMKKSGKLKLRATRDTLNRELVRLNKMMSRLSKDKIPFKKFLQHCNTWHGFAKHRCSDSQIMTIRNHIRKYFEKHGRKPCPRIVNPVNDRGIDLFDDISDEDVQFLTQSSNTPS